MNVIAIASQKGGAGKSTFAANLAVLAGEVGKPTLLIDTDAQGSLSVWRNLRSSRTPLLVPCRSNELGAVLETARRNDRIEWVFIDGPPQNNEEIAEMMLAATLVLIPTRTAVFDIASTTATIEMARRLKRPFFVALNAVMPKRGIAEAPQVISARRTINDLDAPIWRGAVAHRAAYAYALASGQGITEFEEHGPAAEEMRMLWRDLSQAARAMAIYHPRPPRAADIA